ncbi:Signal sequence receptor subunit delta [Aphelenchoides fujianensis]|nr:Signal sequence receptor subunit delta [Aphelenchoides fujianensis]
MLKLLAALLLTCAVASAAKCESPKHSATTFSTTDAFFHFHTSFIAEFALQCSNNVRDAPFFAVVNGKEYGVAVSEETLHYQVSWHLPNEEASSQSFDVQIYDEDTFEEYKKDVRNGGPAAPPSRSSRSPTTTRATRRSSPISSETVALGLALVAFYYTAFVFRNELKPTV